VNQKLIERAKGVWRHAEQCRTSLSSHQERQRAYEACVKILPELIKELEER
jgi:hypothetical protein